MAAVVEMLGSELQKPDGTKVTTADIAKPGSVIGLYFSAHWCPPCRGFTPQLAEFYKSFREKNSGKSLEFVFVSSDRDQASFDEYFKEMPWLALPFSDRDRKGQLSKKFKVQGIPTLVFLEGDTGEIITSDGRNCVTEDPTGADFPWKPKPFSEMFSGTLKTKGEDTTIAEATKGKITGLYFSAHWCPPCRSFTPTLVDAYKKLKDQGKNFEIIFISSDRSEEAFNEYYGEMPWLSLPYDEKRKKALSNHFKVEGIPTLIILDENHEVIEKNGRSAVMSDKEAKDFPWYPKPLNVLDDMHANCINEGPTLIYFTDGEEAEVGRAKDLLYPIAEAYVTECKTAQKQKSAGTPQIEELCFLYETEESEDIADAVRDYFKLPDRNPLVVLLDIVEKRKFIMPEGDLTKERLQQLVENFKTKKLQYTEVQLR